jgi:Double zinc ribbon
MARLPFRSRRRAAAGDGAPAAAPRRPLPPAAQLRRERRGLLRLREQRIRELGGLVLEMHRQEAFREELVYERCADLAALEDRLSELDAILFAASAPRRSSRGARCECGAPLLWGSHFCANCGRTVGDAPAVACASCGAGMPAEARFCAACGHPVEPTQAPEPAAS